MSDQPSLEYQLAAINAGGYVSNSDPTIARFGYLLTSLEGKTLNSRERIGDMLVTAQMILREKYGLEYGLLELAEGINKGIPDVGERIEFADAMALYIQLLVKG